MDGIDARVVSSLLSCVRSLFNQLAGDCCGTSVSVPQFHIYYVSCLSFVISSLPSLSYGVQSHDGARRMASAALR